MPGKVTVIRHSQQLAAIKSSPQGGVYRDLFRRAVKVQNRAKRNLERAPRRIDTGRLRSDIHIQMLIIDGHVVARIGFNVFYGLFVHDGTGVYGPRGAPITPKRAKYLRFRPKGSKGWVYVKVVQGMKPNPFLQDALPAAKG